MLIYSGQVYIVDPPTVRAILGDIFQHLIWFKSQMELNLVNTQPRSNFSACLKKAARAIITHQKAKLLKIAPI